VSQQINLVNPLLLKKRYAFGLREMALGLGLILAGVLAWAAVLHHQADTLEARAAEQETLHAEAQRQLDEMHALARRPVSALLTERLAAVQLQVAQREALLATLSSTLDTTSTGFSGRLRALALGRIEGVWLNGFTLAHERVELRGSALHAGLLGEYLDRLGRQPPFAHMKFSGMHAGQATAGEGATPAGTQIDFTLYSDTAPQLSGGPSDDR
jgi:hypothetical protein